ncbi:MAG TPA: DUF3106 domain-containing protein [Bryobacteraceae bacterium]|nr:DUF3106 domain-containing protein [Bryobacteraceae bacterium]
MRTRLRAAAALIAAVTLPALGLAQDIARTPSPPAGERRMARRSPLDQLDRLMRMSPEELEQVLSRLPPPRRLNVERRLAQYSRLSPEQRELLRAQYRWFHDLPPEKQFELRRAFARFAVQSPERQDMMREELEHLRSLSHAERWQEMGSPEFRDRFRPNERDIIGRIADLMP